MKISSINTITPKNHYQINPLKSTLSFDGRIFGAEADTFESNLESDKKSKEIENNIKKLKKTFRTVKVVAKKENKIKNYSVIVAKLNNFQMYTTINEEKNEKLLFSDLDNPDVPTKMHKYRVRDGFQLKKSYEFYDDSFKNYKLEIPPQEETDNNAFVYYFSNNKVTKHACKDKEGLTGFEIAYEPDGSIDYAQGIMDKDLDVSFPLVAIYLTKNKEGSLYHEYNQETDDYDAYRFDSKKKKWIKTGF